MADFLLTLNLPTKTVVHSELKLKDYKIILKCLINDPLDVRGLFLNINNVLEKITNLSITDINNLNIIEYILLLTNIRMFSIGNSIFAVYKNENLNVEIPLQPFFDSLTNVLNKNTSVEYNTENINFTCDIPTIKDFIDDTESSFIRNVTYKGKKTSINKLPVKFVKTLTKKIKDIKELYSNIYFFKASITKYDIPFLLDLNSYIAIIKILFNENLLSVYDNIFYLSKICNISSEYLENCSYGEFKIFVKKTEEMLQQAVSKSSNKLQNTIPEQEYEPVDINSLYDGPLEQVSRSEFTP